MHVSVEGSVGLVVLHNRPRNISADSKRNYRNINCKQRPELSSVARGESQEVGHVESVRVKGELKTKFKYLLIFFLILSFERMFSNVCIAPR